MAAKPETALTNRIRKAVLEEYPGSWLVKIHGSAYQTAGIPDLVGCINGRGVGIEVKVPGREQTLTARQAEALNEIRHAGGVAFVATEVKTALDLLGELL